MRVRGHAVWHRGGQAGRDVAAAGLLVLHDHDHDELRRQHQVRVESVQLKAAAGYAGGRKAGHLHAVRGDRRPVHGAVA